MSNPGGQFEEGKNVDTTIHKFFKESVLKSANKPALIDGKKSFTYKELDNLTDSLAGYLQSLGFIKGQIVGIYLEKCWEYIVCCLAVLKAGGAYLHIDLEYTDEIIEKILKDTSPFCVISKKVHPEIANTRRVLLDAEKRWLSFDKFEQPLVSSVDVAFIGYSSGTTGMPKGIKVTHRAAVYAISKFWQEAWSFGEVREFGYSTYLSWDGMGPLMFNATAHIIADNVAKSPARLLRYIKSNEINHTFFTPSLLRAIFDEVSIDEIKKCFANVNVIWLGGEVVTRELLKKALDVLPYVHWLNNYGPSECFVVSQGELSEQDILAHSSFCPAGYVLPEMNTIILDDFMNEVNCGCTGELYVSGPCLADGYINNPELTQQKFIKIEGLQYFRTGDLAHVSLNDKLVIEGRADYIIKKETGLLNLLEIRDKMLELLPISDCVILPLEKTEKLVCFFVKKSQESLQGDPNKLLDSIPENLIPDAFIEIEKVPVNNISQKINYSYLKTLYKQASNKI